MNAKTRLSASAALALCASLLAPGLASAGAAAPAPAGDYLFTGQCTIGCTGDVSGLLTSVPDSSSASFVFTYFPFGTGAASINAKAFSSVATVAIPEVSINFGIASSTINPDLISGTVESLSWGLYVTNGAWQLVDLTPPAITSLSNVQAFGLNNSLPPNNPVLASGTGGAFALSPVPEPQSLALLLAGLGVVGAAAHRRQRAPA